MPPRAGQTAVRRHWKATMKILQISNYFYPHIGGVEQVSRDLARAFAREAERVGGEKSRPEGSPAYGESAAADGDGAPSPFENFEQKIFCFNHAREDAVGTVDGVEIIRAGCFCKIASQSLSFSYGKLLKRAFSDFNPDAVIFHYPNPFAAHYLLKILKKYPRCKLILYWHLDITKQKLLGKLFRGQTEKLLQTAVKIVATSPNYLHGSASLQKYAQKCTVIPCCVSAERVVLSPDERERAKEIRAENEGKILLFAVGRHVPYKGMEYLVRASKLLGAGYSVRIGGKGELTEQLRGLAEGDEKVTFLGRMEDAELKAYMQACDIFCFPSVTKNEAFGIALAEAMAFGKPCVTFKIEGSGVNYVNLDGVTGLEAENRDVEGYARAIERLASDGALREQYGEAAAERVQLLFTQEKFAENAVRLIESL